MSYLDRKIWAIISGLLQNRDLNYDKCFIKGHVMTEAEESYTSHNTNLLDVDGVVKKILTTGYVKEQLNL